MPIVSELKTFSGSKYCTKESLYLIFNPIFVAKRGLIIFFLGKTMFSNTMDPHILYLLPFTSEAGFLEFVNEVTHNSLFLLSKNFWNMQEGITVVLHFQTFRKILGFARCGNQLADERKQRSEPITLARKQGSERAYQLPVSQKCLDLNTKKKQEAL